MARARRRVTRGCALVAVAAVGVPVWFFAQGQWSEPTAAVPVAVVHVRPIGTPHRLLIPAIGVDAAMVPLGSNPDGTLRPPDDVWSSGWFEKGPEPGEAGTAVIAGHVDSRTGPAVFYRLRDLSVGDRVTVQGDLGQSATYVVERSREFLKDAVPADVYARTLNPTLRLITCSGDFDRKAGHYKNNLVVYAGLIQA